jgi:hypothetical protein
VTTSPVAPPTRAHACKVPARRGFTVGFLMLDRQPAHGADVDEVLAYYQGDAGRSLLVAGVYVVPLAGFCFLWFVAAARHRLSLMARREDALLATVQLAAGVLFVAMTFVAAAASVTGVVSVRVGGVEDTAVVSQLLTMTTYGEALLMIYAFRVAAIFIVVSTTRGWKARLFPWWFVIVGYVAALLLLVSLTYARAVVLVVPAWVAITSIIILFRRARGDLEVA